MKQLGEWRRNINIMNVYEFEFLISIKISYFFQFETLSKVLLPILFVLFNSLYWPILLTGYLDGH